MVREGSESYLAKNLVKTRSSVPTVCPYVEGSVHNAHYKPFIRADNARSFPWPGKSHIFWFGPLWFALVGACVFRRTLEGNYGCGQSSRVRAAQGMFDQGNRAPIMNNYHI